jgi:hypothetical protein
MGGEGMYARHSAGAVLRNRTASLPAEIQQIDKGSGLSSRSHPRGIVMRSFDYGAGAELFTNKSKWSRRGPVGYKRFARAADAIRFAVEDLAGDSLASAWLEIGDDRFDATEIHRLYEDEAYPLDRRRPHPRNTVERDGPAAARKAVWWSRS